MRRSPLSITWRLAPLASLASMLAACTSMSGLDGRTDYACQAPPGVQCHSVSGNYANAIRNNLPSQRQAVADSGAASSRPASPPPARGKDAAAARQALPALLREPPHILRLWVKAWEDADHDLVDQGYVYLQVEAGRWLLDHVHQRARDAYAPLRPPQPTASPAPAASAPAAGPPPAPPASPRATQPPAWNPPSGARPTH